MVLPMDGRSRIFYSKPLPTGDFTKVGFSGHKL